MRLDSAAAIASVGLVFVVALILAVRFQSATIATMTAAREWQTWFAVVLLYAASHVMRAARTAAIAMSLLGSSFRTVFAMHFFVAPWSLILPWKIDELIRLLALSDIGGSWLHAAVVIVIDRAADGIMLLIAALVMASAGAAKAATVAGVIGAASLIVTVAIFAAPAFLAKMQSYIFVNHYRPRAIRILKWLDAARRLTVAGRATFRTMFMAIAICTLGAWVFEFAAVAAASSGATDIISILVLTLSRVHIGWRTLLCDAFAPAPIIPLSIAFLVSLLLLWGPFARAYAARRSIESRGR